MDWDWGHLLTGFNGRINRARYWGGAIAFGVGAVMLQFLLDRKSTRLNSSH